MKAIYLTITATFTWLAFIAYQTHQLKLKDSNANRPSSSINTYHIHIYHNHQELTHGHHYI